MFELYKYKEVNVLSFRYTEHHGKVVVRTDGFAVVLRWLPLGHGLEEADGFI